MTKRLSIALNAVVGSSIIAVVLSGCVKSGEVEDGKRPGAASPAPTPTPTSMAQLSLPLESYMPPVTYLAQSGALSSLLMRECMRGFGFQMPASTNLSQAIEVSARIDRFTMGRRYGISDRAAAQSYGYGMPDWTIGSAKPQSIDAFSKEQQAVLTGAPKTDGSNQHQGKQIPKGGCMGEAQRTVGEFNSQSSLGNRLQKKTFQELPNEPGARAVIKKWSQCMEGRGYRYGDPWRAGNEFTAGDDGNTRAGRAETRSAVATVDCTYQTNLLGVLFAVESNLQNAEIEKNAEALSKDKKQFGAMARHLQELTKQYGG